MSCLYVVRRETSVRYLKHVRSESVVPVELELEVDQAFNELGGTLDLPLSVLSYRLEESARSSFAITASRVTFGRYARANALRNPNVVGHENPPVAVDGEGYPPAVVRALEPKVVV
jgi:hypothetical protein